MRAQGAYFEGDVGVIAYVQCFLYHVSSSINVPIFRIIWLGTSGQTLYCNIPSRVLKDSLAQLLSTTG